MADRCGGQWIAAIRASGGWDDGGPGGNHQRLSLSVEHRARRGAYQQSQTDQKSRIRARKAAPSPSSVRTEYASAEKGQLCAPVSGSFDQFDSVDMPLYGPGAPRITKGVGDCLQVLRHPSRQTREWLQSTGRRIDQPLLERRHIKLMECNTEALDELVTSVELLIRGEHTLQIEAFLVFQQLRCTQQQPGHVASELTTVPAPIRPPLQQIGQEGFNQPWASSMVHVFLTGRCGPVQQAPHGLGRYTYRLTDGLDRPALSTQRSSALPLVGSSSE